MAMQDAFLIGHTKTSLFHCFQVNVDRTAPGASLEFIKKRVNIGLKFLLELLYFIN